MSKSKSKNKTKRVELDVRNESPFFSNYDYSGSKEGDDTSPGQGLYHGEMDKYDSVMEFRKEKAKARKKRIKSWVNILNKK